MTGSGCLVVLPPPPPKKKKIPTFSSWDKRTITERGQNRDLISPILGCITRKLATHTELLTSTAACSVCSRQAVVMDDAIWRCNKAAGHAMPCDIRETWSPGHLAWSLHAWLSEGTQQRCLTPGSVVFKQACSSRHYLTAHFKTSDCNRTLHHPSSGHDISLFDVSPTHVPPSVHPSHRFEPPNKNVSDGWRQEHCSDEAAKVRTRTESSWDKQKIRSKTQTTCKYCRVHMHLQCLQDKYCDYLCSWRVVNDLQGKLRTLLSVWYFWSNLQTGSLMSWSKESPLLLWHPKCERKFKSVVKRDDLKRSRILF